MPSLTLMMVEPRKRASTQVPFAQPLPMAQALLHAPQLLTSVATFAPRPVTIWSSASR